MAAAAPVLAIARRAHLLDLTSLSAVKLGCRLNFKWVTRNVSFSVQPGSALLLQGPNGSGKTTLLRAVASFGQPQEGAFFVNGEHLAHADYHAVMRENAHYVGARLDGLTDALGVDEQLRMLCLMTGGTDARLEAAYERMQVPHLRDRIVRQLSTGQRRMLSFVRLLATPRRIWLLDEPTIALDTSAQARIESAIREHRQAGGIVIVASHANIALDHAVSLRLT